jgi:hypothetical protein
MVVIPALLPTPHGFFAHTIPFCSFTFTTACDTFIAVSTATLWRTIVPRHPRPLSDAMAPGTRDDGEDSIMAEAKMMIFMIV